MGTMTATSTHALMKTTSVVCYKLRLSDVFCFINSIANEDVMYLLLHSCVNISHIKSLVSVSTFCLMSAK